MAHVLVVDDDPLFREITAEMLIQDGHTVETAENGMAVRRIARAPALAIVDMLMPERDGIETIGDLKTRWPEVKIVGVTSGGRSMAVDLLLRTAEGLGADATLRKPVQAAALTELVRQLVG